MSKVKKEGFNVSAVYWTDATYSDEGNENLKPANAVIFGVIIELNRKFIKVAGEVFDDGDFRRVQAIPRKMIHKIITLKDTPPEIEKVFETK